MIAVINTPRTAAALAVTGALLLTDTASAQQTEVIGDFFFSRQHDPFTGESHDILFTISIEPSSLQGGLGWKCDANDGLYVNVLFGRYVSGGLTDEVEVRAHFDTKEPLEVGACPMSSGHKGAMLHADKVAEFTKAAKAGNRLLVEVHTPGGGDPLTYTFSLKGLTRGLEFLPCAPRPGTR